MSMFDNYNINTVGDNRHRFLKIDELDEIVIGETCNHIFVLNFNFDDDCDHFDIFYHQGYIDNNNQEGNILHLTENNLDTSTAIGIPLCVHKEITDNGKTLLTVSLSSEMTKSFINYRDTFAQLRVVMKNDPESNTLKGQTIVGDLNRVIVKNSLI